MSFLVAAALALGLLVVAPVAAHLLRRGRAREQEFPPASLVPVAYRSARKRSRLEDRWLLLARAILILVLSIVGAVPFVRCSRLALDRDAGASVALALVLDDSLSMRARVNDTETRWDQAIKGARDLLKSTREGDAVSIVLAGKPARLALSTTTDLGVVRETLDKLTPEDRATDLRAAIRLAESALKPLPHVDKRVAVLSDFATDTSRLSEGELWAPLAALRNPMENCGIVRALGEGHRVSVTVACTSSHAAQARKLVLRSASGTTPNPDGDELGEVALEAQAGTQELELKAAEGAARIDAFLSGSDALEEDDYAPVAQSQGALLIGVLADPATASTKQGAASVIEQALNALAATDSLGQARSGEVRPLSLMPEDDKELDRYAAFVVDDPPGFTPESRAALNTWLNAGGFAAAFLGPNVDTAQLGASFEPFAHGALTWEKAKATSIVGAQGLLGDAGSSLRELAPAGRVRLAGAQLDGAEVALRWDDEEPWMLRRRVGRGQLWTFGLPVSVRLSDLALRPAFLALLERFVHDAAQSNGQRVTEAGTPWRLDESARSVEGPKGVELPNVEGGSIISPAIRGRYRVVESKEDFHERIVTVDESEVVTQPENVKSALNVNVAGTAAPNVDVSREFALFLLLLVACELLLRLVARLRLRNQNPT